MAFELDLQQPASMSQYFKNAFYIYLGECIQIRKHDMMSKTLVVILQILNRIRQWHHNGFAFASKVKNYIEGCE